MFIKINHNHPIHNPDPNSFLGGDNDDEENGRIEDQTDRNVTNVTHSLALAGPSLRKSSTATAPAVAVAVAVVPTTITSSSTTTTMAHTIKPLPGYINNPQEQPTAPPDDDELHKNQGQNQGQDPLTQPPDWFCPTPASLNPLVLASKKREKDKENDKEKDKDQSITGGHHHAQTDMEKMDKLHDKDKAVGTLKAQLKANKQQQQQQPQSQSHAMVINGAVAVAVPSSSSSAAVAVAVASSSWDEASLISSGANTRILSVAGHLGEGKDHTQQQQQQQQQQEQEQ